MNTRIQHAPVKPNPDDLIILTMTRSEAEAIVDRELDLVARRIPRSGMFRYNGLTHTIAQALGRKIPARP